MKFRVKTSGMGCRHCIKKVEGAMEYLEAQILSMELNDFTVEFDGSPESIRREVEDLGFTVLSIEGV